MIGTHIQVAVNFPKLVRVLLEGTLLTSNLIKTSYFLQSLQAPYHFADGKKRSMACFRTGRGLFVPIEVANGNGILYTNWIYRPNKPESVCSTWLWATACEGNGWAGKANYDRTLSLCSDFVVI